MTGGTHGRTLVIMAKAPLAGLVKTRLARDIGQAQALRWYRAMLAALARRVGQDPRWRTVIAVAPAALVHAGCWTACLPGGTARIAQHGGDLGARMQHVLDHVPPGPLVMVGCDVPGLSAAHVEAAFRALGDHDLVFGPAGDGGYWLVGARRMPKVPRPFFNVRWSSRHALADTLANVRALRVATLGRLDDVDDGAGYRRWRASVSSVAGDAAASAAFAVPGGGKRHEQQRHA